MVQQAEVRKTPLFDSHKAAGARMIPFGGWSMPVSYAGTLKEHKAVRESCGLFDVSHMGEIFVCGPGAQAFLQNLTINDVTRLQPGKSQYSAICNEQGGMLDDLFIYQIKEQEYLICANAANLDKDWNWISHQAKSANDVEVANESDSWAQIAIQGPQSSAVMDAVFGDSAAIRSLEFTDNVELELEGHRLIVARTGYTGEKGYEIFMPNAFATEFWERSLKTSETTGIEPVGLGARDTLRLESCYLLYGNDMTEDVNPLEAGIGWAVRFDCGDFVGRQALADAKEVGVTRKNVAFTMEADGIPRNGMDIYSGEELVGKVTSGSVLPTVGGAGGMALINTDFSNLNNSLEVDIRGKRKVARIVKKPLYSPRVKS